MRIRLRLSRVDYSLTRVTITIVTMTAEQELQEYFKAGREAKNLPFLLNRRIQDGKPNRIFVDGKTLNQIAKESGIRLDTVQHRYSRGIRDYEGLYV